jgi:hypothetical protein
MFGWAGGTHSPTPGIVIKGRPSEQFVRNLGDFWFVHYPHEVRQYKVEVKYLKESLRDGTGLGVRKDIAQRGTIPSRVMALGEQLVPGFWSAGGINQWFKVFPDFDPRTKKMGRFGASA